MAFYGQDTLRLLQSEVDYEEESCWLKNIVRKHRKTFHPIRHILMMIFLAGSLERYFEGVSEIKPFGEGPWPCLNAAAEHYQQEVVENIKVTKCSDTKRPVGTFTCSCGFVYSRRGPDEVAADRLRIGRIKQFGAKWEDKLRYFVEVGKLSMRETARRLQVDVNTVKKYATILKLKPSWHEDKPLCLEKEKVKAIQPLTELLEQKRRLWLDLQNCFQEESCTTLRKRNPGLYAWLYRHDRQWLQEHSSYINTIVINNRVDWNMRDEDLLVAVQQAVKSIKESDLKPIRVTVSQVGKMTGKLSILQKVADKLPLTLLYLRMNVETIEQFQLRRIYWAVRMLSIDNVQIKPWQIAKKAGLRPEAAIRFQAVINELLENQH